jgi:glycosyltransferase involved in cell wall biosynthesis
VSERIAQLHFGRFVHPIYREQLHAVPPGWKYAATHPALQDPTAPTKRVIEQRARFATARALAEHVALRVLSEGGYVHRVRAKPLPGSTIIHSCERLLRDAPLPYVVDLEHAALFVLYQPAALGRPWARSMLERALLDDRLRFLLPWSEAAARSLMTLPSSDAAGAIAPKVRVVSPAIRLAADQPRRRAGGTLRVLFVGTVFYEKGAIEALRAVQSVRKHHSVTLDMVTNAPPEWAAHLEAEPGVRLHVPGGADLIQRLYEQTDVLLFPSHMDTFGYVVLEAMAHGLPVLAPRHLALTETVEDGRSGLLFRPENMLYGDDTRGRFRHLVPPPRRYLSALRRPSEPYVQSIADALARVATEQGLYDRLAEGAFESVRSGLLSIGRRRQLLADVYDAAAA